MNLPNFGKHKPLTALLGLALDGSRLEGVVVRRHNGSVERAQSFTATLTLDPLTNDAELVGREILNHLEAAGIRERHCAVAVPLKWVFLTAHTEIPAIPETDVANFLQIETERGFPCDQATLRVATSRYAQHATFVGIPADHLERLEQVLRAAKLKPVSFTTGTTALQPPSDDGVLALVLGESQVALQITCDGGVASLRALENAIEIDAGRPVVNADLVARETRITLGQLPGDRRAAVNRIRIFGPADLARELADEIFPRFESMGMTVEVETGASVAFSVASRQLTGSADAFEFLPPKIPAWKQLATQYASGKLQTIGAVAAGVAVLVALAFGVQQWQLWRLNSKWNKMAATVGDLDGIQQQIRQYRPWYDDSFRCLTILRELTMVFPEDGTVTAKTFEIRDQNAISCSGTARDNAALLRTLSQLRTVDGVHDVKVDQIRGKTPLQFTFGFQYGNAEVAREN